MEPAPAVFFSCPGLGVDRMIQVSERGLEISVLFKLSFSTGIIHEHSSLDSVLDRTASDSVERGLFILYFYLWTKNIQETSSLLQACGYDTDELESAITATQLAVKTLIVAQDRVVDKFNREGVCVSCWPSGR